MHTRWVITALILVFGLTAWGPVAAQTSSDDQQNQAAASEAEETGPGQAARFRLEPIHVTATRIEKPVTAIPNTVTVVERGEIAQQTTIRDDVQSILEHTVPGFGPSLRKLTGRAETLRGRNPLYLIDGVPQFNPLRDGQRDGKTIDPFFLERIEVIHGSNAIQGVGATGGVVSLLTRSPLPGEQWSGLIEAGLTTHDSFEADGFSYKLAGLTGREFEQLDVLVGATMHQRGLAFDADGDPVGLYRTQGDIMDSASWDLFLKSGFEPDDHQRLQVMVNLYSLRRDGDFRPVVGDRAAGIPTTTEKGDPSADVGDPAENTVSTVSLNYRNTALQDGELIAQLFYQNFAALFEGGTFGNFFRLTPDGPPFLDQSEIQSTKIGLKTIYAWHGMDEYELTPSAGFDYFRDRSSQVLARSGRKWVPETVFNSYAPFVQVDYTLLDRVQLTGGVRFVAAELQVDDFTTIAAANSTFVSGGAPSFNETLSNAGITVDVLPWLSAYASYSEGFTMPDAGRVLRAINTPGQDVDSLLDLAPVVTRNVELGLDTRWDRFRIHVATYWSDTDLGSRLEANANDIFVVRREKTQIRGIDLTGVFDLTEQVAAGFTYAWIEGEFDSDGNGRVDTDLDGLNIAPNRLNLYAEIALEFGLEARAQLSHLFERDFEGLAAPMDADFEGHTLTDLYVAQRLGNGRLSLGIENLLDERYVPYFSQTESFQRDDTLFIGAGRTLTLAYQHQF